MEESSAVMFAPDRNSKLFVLSFKINLHIYLSVIATTVQDSDQSARLVVRRVGRHKANFYFSFHSGQLFNVADEIELVVASR